MHFPLGQATFRASFFVGVGGGEREGEEGVIKAKSSPSL